MKKWFSGRCMEKAATRHECCREEPKPFILVTVVQERLERSFLRWTVSVRFGLPAQSPTSSLQSKPRVFSTITQSRMKPLLQNFTEFGKLDHMNVPPPNVGNTSSATLSSTAPSRSIENVPIKIPSISWVFTGYWYQWSASGIFPCPKQLFCTWFYGKLWNEIFSRFLGGLRVGWDLKNLKQLYEALLLKEKSYILEEFFTRSLMNYTSYFMFWSFTDFQ